MVLLCLHGGVHSRGHTSPITLCPTKVCAYKHIRKLSKLPNSLMLMVFDDSVYPLFNRPVDPGRRAQDICEIVLDDRSYKQKHGEPCTLGEQDVLRLVLKVLGRPILLNFFLMKGMALEPPSLGIQLKLKRRLSSRPRIEVLGFSCHRERIQPHLGRQTWNESGG